MSRDEDVTRPPRFGVLCSACIFAAMVSVSPSPAFADKPARLSASAKLDAAIARGASHVYTLELRAGESAELVVRQQGVDLVIELVDPAGKLIDSVDGPTGRQGE